MKAGLYKDNGGVMQPFVHVDALPEDVTTTFNRYKERFPELRGFILDDTAYAECILENLPPIGELDGTATEL